LDIYKWFWSKLGGRPWTYIIRDVWHEAEWLLQTIWFWMGVAACFLYVVPDWHLNWWQKLLVLWGIYTFGYINGHLFWGTKWIKGQPDGR